MVNWRLLQVDEDQVASILGSGDWHVRSRGDSQRAAHGDAEVSGLAVLEAKLQDVLVQVLIKVDNGIFQVTIALMVVTLSASAMFVYFLSCAHAEVAHVLSSTFLTDFKIGIAV